MKKTLYISMPLKGRTEENITKSIKKMHKMAEIIFDQELDVIDSVWNEDIADDDISCVARHIEAMKDATYFITVSDIFDRLIVIEKSVAREYGLKMTDVRAKDIMPDVFEAQMEECF